MSAAVHQTPEEAEIEIEKALTEIFTKVTIKLQDTDTVMYFDFQKTVAEMKTTIAKRLNCRSEDFLLKGEFALEVDKLLPVDTTIFTVYNKHKFAPKHQERLKMY